ncbi:unnamed protein product, partial [Mesorhabditis belari]|uniref:CHCH domain-containing protein n=1 Tax=Mesorhabditis belari TaxID=2138241 RepID=A0AAF3FGH3_9BILA
MRVGSATSLSSAGFEASCSIDDESLKKIRSYGKFFSTRFVQVVVQSRTNEKFDLTCSTGVSADWFNVRVDELGEVSAQLRKSTTKYPPDIPSISVDFFLYTKDAETLPLESWSFIFDGSKKSAEESSSLYHDLSTLLRSCMLAARMTPTHRYYVKKQGPETFVILYRIAEGASSLDLGSEMKTIRLGSLATQIGTFSLELNYRTRMEIEQKITSDSPILDSYHQIVSTTSTIYAHPAFASSPDTPSSFCEVISHFSTSPASVAASPIPGQLALATSPPGPPLHFITRTRSRTQSTQSANSVNAESPPSSDVGSLEKDGARRSREHSGSLTISKDIPFAGLLTMSFTGALYPLTALTEEKFNHENEEEEATEDKEGAEADDPKMHNPSLENTIVADTPLTQTTPPASTVASVVASTVKNNQSDEEPEDDEQKEQTEVETSKDSKSDELEEKEDDDSFVKIPFFGAGSSPTSMTTSAELGELVSACRFAPNITEFESISVSIERIKKEIDKFETTQGFFDEFVNESVMEAQDNQKPSSSGPIEAKSKDELFFVTEAEFWEPIQDEYVKKLSEMSADEMYPSFNPGPTKPDGSMNFECHCVGHLVASPCGYEFRNVISCQKSASDKEMEDGACADEMIEFMNCALRTECFKTAKQDEEDSKPSSEDK